MAVNAAFTAQSSDGVSSGYATGSDGKATIQVNGNSTYKGAQILIEVCSEDTSAKYEWVGGDGVIDEQDKAPRVVVVSPGYYVRLRQAGSAASGTSITATITTT